MLALTLALLLASASGQGEDCTRADEAGDTFPICFDPGNGLLLGAGPLVQGGAVTPELHAGILLRTERTSRSKGTPWLNTHRLLVTRARSGPASLGLTATLYEGNLRRHLEEGFILVPTARPVRIPFPFDLTLAMRLGHYERRVWEGPGWTLETGRAALLLDPVRTATARVWLGLGPAASHTLRSSRAGTVHELSPFTTLLLDAGYETEDGWWAARVTALAGWTVGLDGGMRFRTRGEVGVERLLIAVNDQPVWLRLSAAHTHGDAGVARVDEWSAGLGLTVRVWSAR
ncbi:hypothetical protein ATI61_105659 [Archangium gephyra]|uniref:Transporter n=1 Tax=Archangium gephyra TaxID=48 RepID=A0AAC8QFT4_9BACT|nr:hypothetical protein [Archangium gephyra]AKJ06351.1 Hypothetical protein AA314_07977 [Archangium gephyra]REG32331.1 hypothetical protein ATI61_105659 [Archangium gephyra]